MTDLTVKSGAKVVINAAPWKEAKALKKAIEREVAMAGGKVSMDKDVSDLVATLLTVDGSDAVETALAPCLARCLYNDTKITDSTFDDPKARADYYEIIVACVRENLGPLVESLFSLLPAGLVAKMMMVKQASPSQNSPA